MLAGSVVDESAATSSPLEFSLRMPPVGGRATAAPLARGHRYLTMHPWGGAGWGRRLLLYRCKCYTGNLLLALSTNRLPCSRIVYSRWHGASKSKRVHLIGLNNSNL